MITVTACGVLLVRSWNPVGTNHQASVRETWSAIYSTVLCNANHTVHQMEWQKQGKQCMGQKRARWLSSDAATCSSLTHWETGSSSVSSTRMHHTIPTQHYSIDLNASEPPCIDGIDPIVCMDETVQVLSTCSTTQLYMYFNLNA